MSPPTPATLYCLSITLQWNRPTLILLHLRPGIISLNNTNYLPSSPPLAFFLVFIAFIRVVSLPWSFLLHTPVSGVRGPLRALRAPLCSVLFSSSRRPVQMENDVYTQIGLLMLIGLGQPEFNSNLRVRQRGVRTRQGLCRGRPGRSRLRFRPSIYDPASPSLSGACHSGQRPSSFKSRARLSGTTVIRRHGRRIV